MPSKKLVTLLETLSGHDLNRFRKFLASPYFNESKELEMLLHWVATEHSKKENSGDSLAAKQAIWKKIFGKKPYNDGHMRRLISELIRHILDFLALEYYRKDPIQEQILLLDILNEPEYALPFAGVLRQAEALQEKSGLQNSKHHYFQYRIEEHVYQYIEKTDRNPEMLNKLESADFHLDCYYIIQKLRHYCDILGYHNFLSTQMTVQLPANFLTWIEENKYLEAPAVHIYFLITKMLLSPEDESFFLELKNLLLTKEKLFQKTELKSFYVHLLNYCIDKKINLGRPDFFYELFDIFKTVLDREILLENGIINPQDYKNIITVGLQVKEFSWVENFIQTYTEKLPPEEQENAKIYNLAKVYFQQNQYDKVIELLREVEYQNHTYALGGKLMLLKTYYELNEYLALDSLIDSFRIYLRRNKMISKEVRQQYMNVLRFVKKLSKVMPGDTDATAKIRREIDECKALADKNWILQKIAELGA